MPEGLQPERTSLAWRRTFLATVTATLALVRLVVGGSPWLMVGAAAMLLVAGVVGLAFGRGGAAHSQDRLATPHQLPSLTWLLCAVIPALALVGAASLVT